MGTVKLGIEGSSKDEASGRFLQPKPTSPDLWPEQIRRLLPA